MGLGFQPRLVAVFRIDQVHGFTLARSREELPITGSGNTCTPETGHGQGRLRFYHRGQRTIYGITFNVLAGQTRELEIIMGIRGFSHFAEAQIKALRQQDIQKPIFVFARCACAQMGERIDKARSLLHV
jgi:hypothetical protein